MERNGFAYAGGNVDQQTLESALDFLIALEPDPEEFAEECAARGLDDSEEYEKLMKKHAASIKCAEDAIKQYARQISPATLAAMQDRYYQIIHKPKYQHSPTALSVCSASLNQAWAGINGWRR